MAREQGADTRAIRAIHLQLGEALRKVGRTEEAAEHFADRSALSEKTRRTSASRWPGTWRTREPDTPSRAKIPLLETSPLAALAPEERQERSSGRMSPWPAPT